MKSLRLDPDETMQTFLASKATPIEAILLTVGALVDDALSVSEGLVGPLDALYVGVVVGMEIASATPGLASDMHTWAPSVTGSNLRAIVDVARDLYAKYEGGS